MYCDCEGYVVDYLNENNVWDHPNDLDMPGWFLVCDGMFAYILLMHRNTTKH